MRSAGLVGYVVLVIVVGPAAGDWWWWPPTGGVIIEPDNPSTSDVVNVTLWGHWPDSCVPYDSTIVVDGNDVHFTVIRDYPPGIGCFPVIMEWSQMQPAGPLSPGTYTVHGRLVGDPFVSEEYTPLTDFIVTDYQFVLSTKSLVVPEGETATFTVRLLNDPLAVVEAIVAHQSGDSDITVESGGSLTFDSSNYSIPQTVVVAAAEDLDLIDGTAVIEVSAGGYLPAKVTIKELDNDTQHVLYVDADTPGPQNGADWEHAYTDLQETLSVAEQISEVSEIRVAQGTYKPAGREGNRNAFFRLVEGLTIKGGYAGFGEANPDAWNPNTYKTILSGDLNGDDVGDFNHPSRNENSRHVVAGVSLAPNTSVLDGFTITSGNGDKGGGIYIHGGRGPAIRNCIIVDNQASEWGGGIYNWASPQITNCILSGNSAGKGGGLYTHAGSPKLTNCTLSDNTALADGGGLYVYGRGGYPRLANCILWANIDSGGSDESAQAHVNYTYESSTVFNHCCIQDWTGTLIGMDNFGDQPLFADPNSRDYHLKSQAGRWDPNSGTWVIDDATSPCIDAGDPMDPIGHEPFPNGGIINMGAYGGTAEASKSYFGAPPCETIVAGDINGDCRNDFLDFRFIALHWLQDNTP